MKIAIQGAIALFGVYGLYDYLGKKEVQPPSVKSITTFEVPKTENMVKEINTPNKESSILKEIELPKELKENFPLTSRNFEQFAMFLGTAEALKLLKETIEFIILQLDADHPVELQKALTNLKKFYKKKLTYISFGIALGGGVGVGISKYLSQTSPFENKKGTIVAFASIGAVLSGFVYSHKYRVQIEEFYKELEIDLSSFLYMLATGNKSIFEVQIIKNAIVKFLNS